VQSARDDPSIQTLSATYAASDALIGEIADFVDAVDAHANEDDWNQMAAHRDAAPGFYYDEFRDLGGFMDLIADDTSIHTAISDAADDVLAAYDGTVVANHSWLGAGGTGLTIYLPDEGEDVYSSYRTLDFAQDTDWDDFLDELTSGDHDGAGRDWAENNDTRSTAHDLGAVAGKDHEYDGLSVHRGNDVDWFRFTTADSGGRGDKVRIRFTNKDGNLDLYLYDSNGQLLDLSETRQSRETVSLRDLAAGEYSVKVTGRDGATNPDYTLEIDAPDDESAQQDEGDGNDDRDKATQIETETPYEGLALAAGDVDWYQFSVSGRLGRDPVVVTVDFDDRDGDVDLELYDPDDQLLTTTLEETSDGLKMTYQGEEADFHLRVAEEPSDKGSRAGDEGLEYSLIVNEDRAAETGDFTATPDGPTQADRMTLRLDDVNDPDGDVQQVEFYRDADGDGVLDPGIDDLLGTGTQSPGDPEVWTLDISGARLPLGDGTLFARAQGEEGGWSDPDTLDVTVAASDVGLLVDWFDAGGGTVWLYDTDAADWADVDVSAGNVTVKGNARGIRQVVLREPHAGLGLAIVQADGSDQAVSVQDKARDAHTLSYIVSDADLSSLKLAGDLLGHDLNGITDQLGGRAIDAPDDIDGDGVLDDLTGLWAQGDVKKMDARAALIGDVVIGGDLGKIAAKAELSGDLDVAGDLNSMKVSNKDGIAISGRVDVTGAIGKMTATGDVDGNVTAGNGLKSLKVTGNLAGDVDVTGNLDKLAVKKGEVSGAVDVTGDLNSMNVSNKDGTAISGGVDVTGAIGKMTATGDVDADVTAGNGLQSLKVTGNLAGDVDVTGNLDKLAVKKGEVSGAVDVTGDLGSVKVTNKDADALTGDVDVQGHLGKVSITGHVNADVAAGNGLDSLSIKGRLAGTVNVAAGDLAKVTVKNKGALAIDSGGINVQDGDLGKLSLTGHVQDAEITLINGELGTTKVTGDLTDSSIDAGTLTKVTVSGAISGDGDDVIRARDSASQFALQQGVPKVKETISQDNNHVDFDGVDAYVG